MNGIGKNIKKLRKERALSQEQLAERLHVTRQGGGLVGGGQEAGGLQLGDR